MPRKRRKKINIALLFVPRHTLRNTFPLDWQGRLNIKDVEAVEDSLKRLGHNVLLVPLDKDVIEKLAKLKKRRKIDLVFNLADDGFWGKSQYEPHVPALLDVLKIPYTGSNYLTLATCLDKITVKEILRERGLPTADWQVFTRVGKRLPRNLKFPLMIKPAREDASIGIKRNSVVKNHQQLRRKVGHILRYYQQPALVEDYLDGREIHVAMVGDEKNYTIFPLLEILFGFADKYPRIYFYETKWVKDSPFYQQTHTISPAEVPLELARRLRKLVLRCFRLFHCRDYIRVDMRIVRGIPYILEINPNPCLEPDAEWIQSGQSIGWDYDRLIKNIIRSARQRFKI